MSRLGYRLTAAADEDVTGVLRESGRLFGPVQRDKYAQILERAIGMVVEDPERPGSRDRRDLADGVRSFHLELAAGRRGAAVHSLYYQRGRLDDGTDGLIILRVLHNGMNPVRHIASDPA